MIGNEKRGLVSSYFSVYNMINWFFWEVGFFFGGGGVEGLMFEHVIVI